MALFDHVDWDDIRARSRRHAWLAAALQAIQARVDAQLTQPLLIPDQPGGWVHEYVCPVHWLPLIYDAQSPHAHRCPQGETYQGSSYDAAWRVLRHRQLADLARDAALLFRLTGQQRLADAASAILLAYARRYGEFAGGESAQPWMLTARAFHQALTEALWAVPLIQAYDLLAPILDQAQDGAIRQGLLQPMARTLTTAHERLIEQDRPASNYTAWLIAALGCLGFALEDAELIERAIDGPGGFRRHLALAVRADGFEFEGSPYYHNFVALAYTLLAEAALSNGIDLFAWHGPAGQSIPAMWRALASLAYPDGTFPEANDGSYWPDSIFDQELCQVYEVALARTGESPSAWLLEWAYRRRGPGRDSWPPLLWARHEISDAGAPQLTSACLPDSGLALLRDRQGRQAAFLSFGPDGGSHTHRDRLSLSIWPWSLDAGSPPYGIPARRTWYQHSLAHNTVLVDGASQAKSPARILACSSNSITLLGENLYRDVRITRRVALRRGVIEDESTLESAQEHQWDWVCHADAPWTMPDIDLMPTQDQLAGDGAGSFVQVFAHSPCEGAITAATEHAGTAYRLRLTVGQPFELLLARCPGRSQSPSQRRHMLLARCRTRLVRFHATYEASLD